MRADETITPDGRNVACLFKRQVPVESSLSQDIRCVIVPPSRKRPERSGKGLYMNFYLSIGPLAALLAGILILVMPRLLNYIVAIYLILIGVVGLFGGPH